MPIATKMTRRDAQKLLANVPEEYVFWSCDGRILRNMKELGEALNSMTQETYAYHSNTEKNDFSNWVRDIIGDKKLAEDLLRLQDRVAAAKAVSERIAFLRKKA